MKKFNLKSLKTVRLSTYFIALISIIIFTTTSALTMFIWSAAKDITGKYETDIAQLRTSISTSITQVFSIDAQNNNFETTKSLIGLLKQYNIISYIYIIDNNTGKVISDDENIKVKADIAKNSASNSKDVQKFSQTMKDYDLFFGMPKKNYTDFYYDGFAEKIPYALVLFVFFAVAISITLSRIISQPLKNLSDAAAEIASGNFNVKIEATNFTEINELISCYSDMEFQLNELYNSLELKVQERTIALEEANHKLKETQAMMVHSEKMRSLGELVAGIAHEINNPVNFIHGNIIILQDYADDLLKLIDYYEANNAALPEEVKKQAEAIKEQIDLEFLRGDIKDLIKSCMEGTQRTKNIVLDLKNFSRMEEMVLTQFDIPKEIDTTLNILNNKMKNRITLVKNYSEDVPKIEAYGGQLNQVFMNILDNAQDAINGEGTITINTRKVDENVQIEFIDTGAGIPKENLTKVFDPFFTTKPVGKGTGLGMSITYRVINDHNGRIEVDSEVGKGTKFTITLPINHPEKQKHDETEEALS